MSRTARANFSAFTDAEIDALYDYLVARGAARKGELIKVLGTGEIGVALRVTAHAFSATAAAKIERAGGTVSELS